jgi:hypothetical protein
MYFKKTLFTYSILLTVIILTYVGYLLINTYCIDYEKINHATKEKVTATIIKNKGETPNLQTDKINARWTDEAHNMQKQMMDKVLDSLTVIGISKKGKPNNYIVATYNDNQHIYIAYNEIAPYKKVIIEINGQYYVATANKGAISAIVAYMKEQVIKFQIQ